jgi:hypothetical protein
MIEWESETFDLRICSVDEVVDGEGVRFIDRLGPGNGLDHWANNNIWVDDGEVESWLFFFEELPCCLLGQFLGCIVS